MPQTRTISNSDDLIDSRDIISRIEELTDERDGFTPEGADFAESYPAEWAAENPEDAEELAALEALASEAEPYADDWKYGATLVRESYFTDYAMEMLKDIGDLPKDIPWYIEIDEERTAQNVKQDYTAVEFGDITYYVR